VEVKNVQRSVTRDLWNRPIAHIEVDADLKEGAHTRYFRFRFTGKSQGQSTVRDVHLWLTPSGQLYGDW
jgi:hypothetical protein